MSENNKCCSSANEPKIESSCCTPKEETTCCTPKAEESSCCTPKTEESSCCTPKEETSCCTPKAEESSCCTPKTEESSCCSTESTASNDSGCGCAPKPETSSCCTPKTDEGSCCSPKSDDSACCPGGNPQLKRFIFVIIFITIIFTVAKKFSQDEPQGPITALTTLSSMSEVNKFSEIEALFILVEEEKSATSEVVIEAVNGLKEKGKKVAGLTLDKSAPEFATLKVQLKKLPAVMVLSPKGKKAVINQDITPQMLEEKFNTLTAKCTSCSSCSSSK